MKGKLLIHSLTFYVLFGLSCSENAEPEQKMNSNNQEQNQSKHARLANGNVFDGTEGGPIELKLASEWTHRWQAENPEGTRAHFYGREILQKLLDQEGSMGIRFYYGLDEKGTRQLVLVGVNANGEDLLPSVNGRTNAAEYLVVDQTMPCPLTCAQESELN